ncbi:MAG: ferrous iron transport protein B (GTP binding) [Candidatus Scalindua rubra]|uniref:Ferrous iron transport protein B n=1 Tax=Candidatus Scalindua rubra TaxID=1872076 RepID=A0A1E3XBU2_9BACT|nr:MAG: ferrous iron transport protein B (GTP binding) [Candidatus Scalindua rubra]
MNLAMLKPGEKRKIVKIGVRGSLKRRLMDMGLLVGEEVKVEKVAPLGDPIEVTIKDYSLSLRKREAKGILVEAMNGRQTTGNHKSVVGSQQSEKKTISVAVAGNPNSGKSTLINAIAGTKLQVGNWPGVTVEKREAVFNHEGKRIKLVDLPGTYSLSPYTQEEIIARDYLAHEKPDVIVDVVDSTNLERNLYLTVQLMELGIPVVVALNIYDEAGKKGYKIDIKAMKKMLGILVIPTVATRKKGLSDLLNAVVEAAENQSVHRLRELNYGEDIESAVRSVEEHVKSIYPSLVEKYPPRWLAIKLMEGDKHILKGVDISDNGNLVNETVSQLTSAHGEDIESIMADARYAQTVGLTQEVLKKPEIRRTELTEKIDRVVLNRFCGIPIFLAAMWLVFKLTFDVSTPFVDWVDAMTAGPFTRWAEAILGFIFAPDWVVSLCTDGIIAGVGFVLVFVPVIFAMMFFITFLEGSGYMARAAFVMDRAMHAMGLHGKSFIPMLLGFGCNVPAIYATRTLENPTDKALTALIIPLMSCGARLPVYVLFTGVFFPVHSGTVLWSLYVMGIVLAVGVGVIFRKTLFKGEATMFIMELPPYRMPSFRNLMIHTWEKGKHFLIKAGTYIFAISVLVWFLLNIPWGVEHKKDSLLGMAGQTIAPVFEPLGFGGWEAASSLVTGIIAKEIVVGTMGEIYVTERKEEQKEDSPTLTEDLKEIGLSFAGAVETSALNVFSTFRIASISTEEDEGQSRLRSVIHEAFTPLRSYAFMAFVLLYAPCMVTAIAFRQEFGTWKWFGVAFVYEFILAWVVAFAIYQGGSLLGMQ